jgi:hypothetical protein
LPAASVFGLISGVIASIFSGGFDGFRQKPATLYILLPRPAKIKKIKEWKLWILTDKAILTIRTR